MDFQTNDDFDSLIGEDDFDCLNTVPIKPRSNAEASEYWADCGFKIIPVRDWGDGDDPKPFKGWQRKASSDLSTVRAWWRRWPDAVPGLPTGAVNGFSVMDLDQKDGKDGIAALAALGFPDLAALTPCRVRSRTGGGRHLYFRYDPRIPNKANAMAPGIDFRSDGGFIYAPFAIREGGQYLPEGTELGVLDLPALPEKLMPAARTVGSTRLSQPLDFAPGEIEAVLAEIPVETIDDRDTWFRLGAALHHQFAGGDEGFDLWMAASSRGSTYLKDSSIRSERRRYNGFRDRAGKSFTMQNVLAWTPIAAAAREERLQDEAVAEFKAAIPDLYGDDDLDSLLSDDPAPGDDDDWDGGPSDTLDGFALSEDGVGLAFAQRFCNDLRFCHTAGRWFRWEGTHWRREETRLAFDWARETCRHLAAKHRGSSAAKSMSRANSARGVEAFAQADRAFAVNGDAWDRNPWLLGTPGGTVELRTGTIRPAHPRDMITKLTASAPIPLDEFDSARDCPRWLAFLDHATGSDREAIRFLQQWAGYSLTGDTREQALLFVHGPGGSGKSTAVNTIAEILGDYAVNVATETLTASKYDRHSTELARLHGARLARASETEAGRAWAESRLKALTGGDTITARFMRQDDFEFQPQFKLMIVGNHAPRIVNVDEAMRRRFNVMPFTHPPQHRDSRLADALRAEWSGILSWAIWGCIDWQTHGLLRPATVIEATDAYFAEQDTFALWLESECEIGTGCAATMDALSRSFRAFAFQAGDETPMGSKGFSQLMQSRGFRSVKDTAGIRGRGFAGLKLRDVMDDFG